jgi:hypothetical protein
LDNRDLEVVAERAGSTRADLQTALRSGVADPDACGGVAQRDGVAFGDASERPSPGYVAFGLGATLAFPDSDCGVTAAVLGSVHSGNEREFGLDPSAPPP